ncbi:3-hydroxyacyl-CoA dehydrogenase / enoyl-CoA hydratase / 3-hydroxybutyryl-CoA epimerase [Actinoplanes philippinensis]|uniref:3-hydroxyacyl-CoA dehydrogenase / enoyl-CoA hydratase / 3-hydroxybutyryl-CoA epimerase n=1 Tax=Actinoplanes philippinensis TaxID=35752 RepID=A0A1I2KFJ9_9ACTN|nr:enoyl-CoA hydratase/isomerase family protein [Actinoplanes philippinensis]SFF65000.1 3-hydroxyacyl-CoA dehydrogenase / enoyl-CoA hydratase / 3-hydroxybutyryl-CoA epimerase [Actinoplanes philippinensis]
MTDVQQSGSARWSWDAEGVVTVVLDDPGRTANMLNRRHYDGLTDCLDDLTRQLGRLRGVVLTSAKHSFIAGPDFVPSEITPDEAAGLYDLLTPLRDQARRLENLGRPVAAALNGSALGGGFELALACHHRVGTNDPSAVWALAETGMGILPAGGGTVRATRMFGIAATVLDIVGPGTAYHPAQALAAGLVDELADDVVAAARTWVLAQPSGHYVQRWERPGHQIPGGTAEPPGLADEVSRRSKGSPVRALAAVLEVAVRSASAPLEEAFETETAACRALLSAPEFPDLTHLFHAMRALATAPAEPPATGMPAGMHEFPQIVANPLAAVFFAPDAPVVEITDADLIPAVRARGGIPVLIHSGDVSFIQTLLEAGPDPTAMTDAAHRALDDGLRIDPAGADVASVVAAGFPAWTGGVLHAGGAR